MAYIAKIGGRWKAQVSKNGTRASKSFHTKAHAKAWAYEKEVELESGIVVNSMTLWELITRYSKEITPKKEAATAEQRRIASFADWPLMEVKLCDLNESDVSEWRDWRLKKVKPSTVNREWNLLSNVVQVAVKEWKLLESSPFTNVKRPKNPSPRCRLPTDEEIARLKVISGYQDDEPPKSLQQKTVHAFLVSCQTAMRTGEICKTLWVNVGSKLLHIPEKITKTRVKRDVPLGREARALIDLLPNDNDLMLGLKSSQVDTTFRRLTSKADIDDLHFHDARAYALTWMAGKVDALTLAKISGHRDLKILLNTYYRKDMSEVADQLD